MESWNNGMVEEIRDRKLEIRGQRSEIGSRISVRERTCMLGVLELWIDGVMEEVGAYYLQLWNYEILD